MCTQDPDIRVFRVYVVLTVQLGKKVLIGFVLAGGEPIMLQNLHIMLCCTAPKELPITPNKCPYHAQILLIKWLMDYNINFPMAN